MNATGFAFGMANDALKRRGCGSSLRTILLENLSLNGSCLWGSFLSTDDSFPRNVDFSVNTTAIILLVNAVERCALVIIGCALKRSDGKFKWLIFV